MRKLFVMTAVVATAMALLVGCVQNTTVADDTENASAAVGTLEIVKQRGTLVGGVTTGIPGYSAPDADGNWAGFDVDVIRAVAAAVLGDSEKASYRPLTAKERFTALQTGEIDVLSRVSTWTTVRDTTLGLNFAGISFYDGQAIMVPKSGGVTSISELDGAAIAVQAGTTTELNLGDYFRTNGLEYEQVVFEQNEQAAAALEAGRADAFTSDASQLYALRSKMANPEEYLLLPRLISKEPLGPVVREGDDQWMDVVRWTLNAMIAAEEFGITSANVDEIKSTTNNPEIKRILGLEGSLGEGLGLDKDWAYRVIKQVGNYGESFRRHLGADSPLGMERGMNALWTDEGGMQYALPFR
ncbi:amino acid ABC transporter substrate-binding protein [Candidatus Haliotispira prima]|uniref:Amino acid ABC transporter substrate-binding protein n=1 Tax=Candidatus Haliotispira prima TaxID=3034016 RepID=A0ABY8MM85_9SPIO|nr:amino acid ABC transporter substrate-binding protein [Candidatus Haliotispira prima]